MEDEYISAITTDDLKEIKEMFDSALEDGLNEIDDDTIDKGKVINQFENDIRQKIRIDYPQTEQIKVQELKDSIERMEIKAKRMKTQIVNSRNRYIEGVRNEIEKKLNDMLPQCPVIDIDKPIEMTGEEIHLLELLDEQIRCIEGQITECEANSRNMGQYENFCNQSYQGLTKM